MTDQITIPADQPDASYGQVGDRFYGIYRLPHGKWRDLLGNRGQRLVFASAQEATRAALAKVNSLLFREIRAEPSTPSGTGGTLAKEAAEFRSRKAKILRRGAGRRPVVVETKRVK